MPPPTHQPYDPTRGMISCFAEHGLPGDPISAATSEALRDILVDRYEEAFRRLPVEDVPYDVNLVRLIDRGGLCLGLLDPVTNVIVNTVSLLSDGFDTNPSTQSPLGPGIFPFRASPSRRRAETSRDSWRPVARRSILALLEFMRAYFRLLTKEQAGRYLFSRTRKILASVAVLLVEHDLYIARPASPDPRSGRTRNSLRLAATHGNHPSPGKLVSYAMAWLPSKRLKMLAPVLRHEGGSNRLTVHDVKTILHVLRHQDDTSAMTTMQLKLEEGVESIVESTTSCVDLGDGRITYTTSTITIVQRTGDHISSLRRHQDMDSTLSYSTHATPPVQDSPCPSVQSLNADTCPYVRSLQMSLCGTIHGFYLKALSMLPSHSGRNNIRSILLAGHCYGPMDPVSNILVSAIWYDANFPLNDADLCGQAHDILDTLTMLRAVYRSLRGLVGLLHATSGQQLPLHDILKYLSYSQCVIAAMLQPHLDRQRLDQSSPNPLRAAATAAEHPKAASIATFFASLAPTKLDQLRSLMMSATASNTPLCHESLTQIYNLLKEERIMPWLRPPKLSQTALSILTRKRKAYTEKKRFIRGRIKLLLQDYAVSHPSEPKYDLDFVCGVTAPGLDQCYHVNFMAATKSTCENRLFFAEFRLVDGDQPKPSICCPLPQPYDTGRCYYGQESARHIAYPDHSVDYFSSDITRGGFNNIEDILDTDFTYFDSERDVVLARVLQKQAKQEEVMQRSSTGRRAEWSLRAC
ncbi:unnamed protein product [Alopecurus aequalis]